MHGLLVYIVRLVTKCTSTIHETKMHTFRNVTVTAGVDGNCGGWDGNCGGKTVTAGAVHYVRPGVG